MFDGGELAILAQRLELAGQSTDIAVANLAALPLAFAAFMRRASQWRRALFKKKRRATRRVADLHPALFSFERQSWISLRRADGAEHKRPSLGFGDFRQHDAAGVRFEGEHVAVERVGA